MKKYCEFLDKCGFSGILITNLSKAFDCIDCKLLIAKMHAYGLDTESLKFIDNYLAGRKQSSVDTFWSKTFNILGTAAFHSTEPMLLMMPTTTKISISV